MRLACASSQPAFGPQPVPQGAAVCAIAASPGPLTALLNDPQHADGTALLIPGFTGSKEDFLGIQPVLADRGWRTLAYSQRGQADSAAPPGVDSYRLEDFTDDAVSIARDLVEAVDGPVHLLGHSFGGIVARNALLSSPELFSSLTVFSSGDGPITMTPDIRGQFARLIQHTANPTSEDGQGSSTADADEAMLALRASATSPDNLVGIARILSTTVDRSVDLRRTGLPVHVIHGENDDVWPLSRYAADARAMLARHTVVPGAAHSAQNESPVVFADAVADFWKVTS